MIYLDNHLVLYTPLNLNFDRAKALNEGKTIINKYGAWISSKGTTLSRPTLIDDKIENDKLEKESRQKQRDERPEDFPVKGVLLRGIAGLNYSFSYLVTDTSLYDWTSVSEKCPYLLSIIKKLPYEKIGRINLQTVEAGMSLHKHIDSIFRMDSETKKRRQKHLEQYGISEFNMDVNCLITIVLQGSGINFHYTRSNEKIKMSDDVYYFRPDLIHHSVDISDQQRIICRIEGKASTEMIDMIQEHAKANSDRVLVI